MVQVSLGRSSKLEFPFLQYLHCQSLFEIDIQEKDLSQICLLVLKVASKWPAKESDHHRVCADAEHVALPIPSLLCALAPGSHGPTSSLEKLCLSAERIV